jgi:phosphohistidine phosphatase
MLQGGIVMNLLIVRHAEAIEKTSGGSDERRYLTPEGRFFFRKTAGTMQKKGIDPNLILSSPLVRAVQTADILAETISYVGSLVAMDELAPGFDITALQKLLIAFQPVKELVIVGHEPDLSGIITSLLSLPDRYKFKKGTALKLKIDPADLHASAAFRWLADGRKLITSQEKVFPG